MKEKETYTVKEAMDRRELKSKSTFLRWERKYPQAFVVVKQTKGLKPRKGKLIHYDKARLDRFAETREHLHQEKKTTYTREQAMERLKLKNRYAFVRLEKMYPEAFVIVTRDANKHALYDKALFDRFANWRARFKEEQP